MHSKTITEVDIFICELYANRQRRYVEECIRRMDEARLEAERALEELNDIHVILAKYQDRYARQLASKPAMLSRVVVDLEPADRLGDTQ